MSGTSIQEDDIAILCIPVADENPRQWSVGEHTGALFSEDETEDYTGWAVVIEVRSEAEARMIAGTLCEHIGPGLVGWSPEDEPHLTTGPLQ